MGFFDRLGQVIKGKASNAVSGVESRNPEAVYTAAIAERERKYGELKKACAEVVYMRDKRKELVAAAERELAQIEPSLAAAISAGEDEAALALLERQEVLQGQVEELTVDVTRLEAQVTETREGMETFKQDLVRLKREKSEMLARNATAEARIQMQDTLTGLSDDADVKGLAGVREHIQALADNAGMDDGRVTDTDLAKSKAKLQLAALKRQMRGEAPAEEEDAAPDEEDATTDAEIEDLPKRTL